MLFLDHAAPFSCQQNSLADGRRTYFHSSSGSEIGPRAERRSPLHQQPPRLPGGNPVSGVELNRHLVWFGIPLVSYR
ncbi:MULTISPECIES: hypothetical protein [unclassified Streptomyces]|uniref:hypothetical protein n=1 Tax=unclassified Streptomyces TaxID=2593676 RepID=UPI000A7DB4B7|nr:MULTISPECIES: hypothetical protein [unclassified Streptomyces]